MSNQQVKNYIEEAVVEEVYAGITTVPGATTDVLKVASGTIGAGYDGVIVSIAINQQNNVFVWVKKQEKQVYDNGLNSAALPASLGECPLFVGILEKEKWELGLTNPPAGDKVMAWLIRIRLFRKGV
ncbi:hypothetical protein ES702_01796 [subsurface metagenome]